MERKRIAIDTNIFIPFLRCTNIAKKQETTLYKLFSKNYTIYTTAINVIELYAGAKTDDKIAAVDAILREIEIIPFDNNTLKSISLRAVQLLKINKYSGIADLMIASACIENQIPLLTDNRKHFEVFNELSMVVIDDI